MSKSSVFIIESLTFEDENKERFEGKFLSHILKLSGIETKYYYIRTVCIQPKVDKLPDYL